MLTGHLPFPGRSTPESVFVRLTVPPKTLASVKGDVEWPPAVQAVLDRALAREPDERYQSAREFGHELARAVQWMSAGPLGPFDTHVPPFSPPPSTLGGVSGGVSRGVAGGAPSRATPGAASAASTAAAVEAGPAATPVRPAPPSTRRFRGARLAAAAAATLGAASVAAIVVARRSSESTPQPGSAAHTPGLPEPKAPAASGGATPQPSAPSTQTPSSPPPTTPVSPNPAGGSSSGSAPENATTHRPPAVADPEGDQTVTVHVPAAAIQRPQRPAPVRPAPVRPTPATTGPSTADVRGSVPSAPATDTAASAPPPAPPAALPRPEEPRPSPPAGTPPASTGAAASTEAAAAANREKERAAAAVEVRRTIDELVQALSARDMGRFQRAYPSMTAAEREGWQALFGSRDVSEFSARLVGADQPEIDGTTAHISFGVRLEFKDRERGRVTQPQQYRATLQRGSGGWRVASLRAES